MTLSFLLGLAVPQAGLGVAPRSLGLPPRAGGGADRCTSNTRTRPTEDGCGTRHNNGMPMWSLSKHQPAFLSKTPNLATVAIIQAVRRHLFFAIAQTKDQGSPSCVCNGCVTTPNPTRITIRASIYTVLSIIVFYDQLSPKEDAKVLHKPSHNHTQKK